jgi:hypothetical protein
VEDDLVIPYDPHVVALNVEHASGVTVAKFTCPVS